MLDLRVGVLARALTAAPERLHDTLDESRPEQWVVIDEISRVPAVLGVVHQRLDREPARRFLLTGSSARAPVVLDAQMLVWNFTHATFLVSSRNDSDTGLK